MSKRRHGVIALIAAVILWYGPAALAAEETALQTPVHALEGPMKAEHEACVRVGGAWKTFGDSCRDQCGTQGMGCGAVLTDGCDCGQNRCFQTQNKTCENGKSAADDLLEQLQR